jgi:hypothetical protein
MFTALVFTFALLSLAAGPGPAPQELAQKEPPKVGLQVDVTCSLTKLRTPVARVSWRTTKAALASERLEVTVYKDGFKSGAFATLSPVRVEQKFDLTRLEKIIGPRPPGMNLVVTSIQSPPQKDAPPVVEVEGLEPGLNYFWRVLRGAPGAEQPSEVVRSRARACPADMPKEAKPPGASGPKGDGQ